MGAPLAPAEAVVILQALLAFLRKSLGKILQALFGWAVLAVFGRVDDDEKTLFSIAIASAAAWPVLLLGVVWPRPVAVVLTLLPIPKGTPEELVRAVWIALAALIPLFVGFIFGRRAGRPMPLPRRLVMGFPVTAALAAAFLIVLVTVPFGKLVAFLRNRKQRQIVLVSPPGTYREVAREVREALGAGGIDVAPAKPPWHLTALAALLSRLGGDGLSAYAPRELAYFRGQGLRVAVYPGGVNLVGLEHPVAQAQALVAERAPRSEGLQTTSEDAQKVEKKIRQAWKDVEAKRFGKDAEKRLLDLLTDVSELDADYEEWETVYRQALQVVVAAQGGGRLLERAVRADKAAAEGSPRRLARARRYARRGALRSAQSGLSKVAERVVSRLLFGGRR